MGLIKVIGLGPGSYDDLTLRAVMEMERSGHLYLRTKKHPVVQYLDDTGIKYETFDDIYDSLPTFEDVYSTIASSIIDMAEKFDEIVYAVPGHPLVAEDTVRRIIADAPKKGIEVEIIPSVSFIDAMINALSIDPIDGLKILDGLQLDKQMVDVKCHNIITQVYNRRVASDIKLRLMEYYKDETDVVLVRAAGVRGIERIEKMPLYDIDRVEWVDYLTSLYIPPSAKRRYDFDDLISIMDRLRGEGGCPWDREQTHESLKQYLVEESYEVLEAIDENDMEKLVEELGDVLLQVVFHSRIASENKRFDIIDVTDRITDKMIKRHTHIFGDDICTTSAEVLGNWEEIKRKEQDLKTITDSLRHVPKHMPALMRSYKVQEKAARVGFDWENTEGAISKINEELQEFLDVYKSENNGKIIEELGDLLFAVVNVCRFMDVVPEFALNMCTEKFIRRFEYIEDNVVKSGKTMEEMTLKELDELWELAKMNKF